MRISFFGAAGEVTGSCYLIETAAARILVDCGLFQGSINADIKNRRRFPFDPRSISAVVLTHAHLDHSGRLPRLIAQGYNGPILTTDATPALAELVLRDAARLNAQDVERTSRRRVDCGRQPCPELVLFTEADVTETVRRFRTAPLGGSLDLPGGGAVEFFEAGHILGSASLRITLPSNGNRRAVHFSGDIGERGMPLMNDPAAPAPGADLVVCESTYGDRDHKSLRATRDELREVLDIAQRDRGVVLIPAFAIGRSQTLLLEFKRLWREGFLRMPIVLDSPMAIAATRLHADHSTLLDNEARKEMRDGGFQFPLLRLSNSGEDSRNLNGLAGPAAIIAGSGMATGGRIVHHLRHRLPDRSTHVLIAGYQAEGSLGRRLVNGDKQVRIFGQMVPVAARIHTLGGLSAHAGQSTLLRWAGAALSAASSRIALTHGEARQRQAFSRALAEQTGVIAQLPQFGDAIVID